MSTLNKNFANLCMNEESAKEKQVDMTVLVQNEAEFKMHLQLRPAAGKFEIGVDLVKPAIEEPDLHDVMGLLDIVKSAEAAISHGGKVKRSAKVTHSASITSGFGSKEEVLATVSRQAQIRPNETFTDSISLAHKLPPWLSTKHVDEINKNSPSLEEYLSSEASRSLMETTRSKSVRSIDSEYLTARSRLIGADKEGIIVSAEITQAANIESDVKDSHQALQGKDFGQVVKSATELAENRAIPEEISEVERDAADMILPNQGLETAEQKPSKLVEETHKEPSSTGMTTIISTTNERKLNSKHLEEKIDELVQPHVEIEETKTVDLDQNTISRKSSVQSELVLDKKDSESHVVLSPQIEEPGVQQEIASSTVHNLNEPDKSKREMSRPDEGNSDTSDQEEGTTKRIARGGTSKSDSTENEKLDNSTGPLQEEKADQLNLGNKRKDKPISHQEGMAAEEFSKPKRSTAQVAPDNSTKKQDKQVPLQIEESKPKNQTSEATKEMPNVSTRDVDNPAAEIVVAGAEIDQHSKQLTRKQESEIEDQKFETENKDKVESNKQQLEQHNLEEQEKTGAKMTDHSPTSSENKQNYQRNSHIPVSEPVDMQIVKSDQGVKKTKEITAEKKQDIKTKEEKSDTRSSKSLNVSPESSSQDSPMYTRSQDPTPPAKEIEPILSVDYSRATPANEKAGKVEAPHPQAEDSVSSADENHIKLRVETSSVSDQAYTAKTPEKSNQDPAFGTEKNDVTSFDIITTESHPLDKIETNEPNGQAIYMQEKDLEVPNNSISIDSTNDKTHMKIQEPGASVDEKDKQLPVKSASPIRHLPDVIDTKDAVDQVAPAEEKNASISGETENTSKDETPNSKIERAGTLFDEINRKVSVASTFPVSDFARKVVDHQTESQDETEAQEIGNTIFIEQSSPSLAVSQARPEKSEDEQQNEEPGSVKELERNDQKFFDQYRQNQSSAIKKEEELDPQIKIGLEPVTSTSERPVEYFVPPSEHKSEESYMKLKDEKNENAASASKTHNERSEAIENLVDEKSKAEMQSTADKSEIPFNSEARITPRKGEISDGLLPEKNNQRENKATLKTGDNFISEAEVEEPAEKSTTTSSEKLLDCSFQKKPEEEVISRDSVLVEGGEIRKYFTDKGQEGVKHKEEPVPISASDEVVFTEQNTDNEVLQVLSDLDSHVHQETVTASDVPIIQSSRSEEISIEYEQEPPEIPEERQHGTEPFSESAEGINTEYKRYPLWVPLLWLLFTASQVTLYLKIAIYFYFLTCIFYAKQIFLYSLTIIHIALHIKEEIEQKKPNARTLFILAISWFMAGFYIRYLLLIFDYIYAPFTYCYLKVITEFF